MKTRLQLGLVTIAVAFSGVAAPAQDKLPTGQEVVDRFVAVTGGREKYEAVKTMTAKGEYRIAQFNTEGTIEIYFARPDKARMNVDIPNYGKVERGQLGKVAWEVTPQGGPRLLDAQEADRFLAGLDMRAAYDAASLYESIENAGIEEVEGEPCYKLNMKRKGSDEVDVGFYSVETGLAVKALTHEPTQVGKLTITTTFSDYEEIGGIKSAMSLSQEMAELGMTQEIHFDSVEYNKPVDDGVFELPEEVKELAKDKE
jgi:outer membrane lipoprotein-sorting protein